MGSMLTYNDQRWQSMCPMSSSQYLQSPTWTGPSCPGWAWHTRGSPWRRRSGGPGRPVTAARGSAARPAQGLPTSGSRPGAWPPRPPAATGARPRPPTAASAARWGGHTCNWLMVTSGPLVRFSIHRWRWDEGGWSSSLQKTQITIMIQTLVCFQCWLSRY